MTYTDFILHFGENTWIRRLPFNNSQPRPCIGVEPRWFIFRAVSCGRFNYFDDECLSTKGFNSHCTCCHCFTLNKLLFELKITSRKNWTWFWNYDRGIHAKLFSIFLKSALSFFGRRVWVIKSTNNGYHHFALEILVH